MAESPSGDGVRLPLYVCRGERKGPTVCVTAAVHGDEINGTGAIRQIAREQPFSVVAGTLVLVPVVNILGFERHSRYLPDRRDLNRSFPGSHKGSQTGRLARSFFDQVISRCAYCIDLHTAAVRRTNFPNVRADMSDPAVAALARAFGAELIVSGKGPKGSLRAAACEHGCPTIILEAGEVWKVEPSVVEYAIRGIRNCLVFLGMVEGEPTEPPYRIEADSTKWVRAEHGGFLEFHVGPGDIVNANDMIATNTSLLGDEINTVSAPQGGVVLGMTTMPSVVPGDPICHIAYARKGTLRKAERIVNALGGETLHERVRGDLASSMLVTDAESQPPAD
ncbi:MAG: succinylglutamate desuccinylase/aspartoacylase family protein [Phycisphaerae bacterium]|nr:succinylglutamate desuccinylase/aspartoacylase family protein [Phycisphaerae bacterium]NNF41920.1 succinylglutamate desuccinylase/aspartoacylase family protein [Phycisphaerales bacterium]